MARQVLLRIPIAAAFTLLSMACLAPSASAQSATDVVGTWTLVSSVTVKDGAQTDQFGLGAKGRLVLDSTGHFMLTIIGPDLPKFVSNNRASGTPEENKAVMSHSIAIIGEYSVSTAEKTFTIRGEQDCQRRGFKRSGFFEVDTNDAKDWTIRLTDPSEGGAKAK